MVFVDIKKTSCSSLVVDNINDFDYYQYFFFVNSDHLKVYQSAYL